MRSHVYFKKLPAIYRTCHLYKHMLYWFLPVSNDTSSIRFGESFHILVNSYFSFYLNSRVAQLVNITNSLSRTKTLLYFFKNFLVEPLQYSYWFYCRCKQVLIDWLSFLFLVLNLCNIVIGFTVAVSKYWLIDYHFL